MWEVVLQRVDTLSDFAIFALIALFLVLHGRTLLENAFLVYRKKKRKDCSPEALSDQLLQLSQYYNHDTTKALECLKDQQQESLDKLKSIENILGEIKEYGVKVRNK